MGLSTAGRRAFASHELEQHLTEYETRREQRRLVPRSRRNAEEPGHLTNTETLLRQPAVLVWFFRPCSGRLKLRRTLYKACPPGGQGRRTIR